MRNIYYGFIGIFLFGFSVWTLISHAFGTMCGNTLVSEIPSPNGKKKVVIFVRSCGATTGFWTNVSIRDKEYKLNGNETGNILTIDDHVTGTDLNYYGGGDVIVRWISDDTVVLMINESAKLLKKEYKLGGIRIRYE